MSGESWRQQAKHGLDLVVEAVEEHEREAHARGEHCEVERMNAIAYVAHRLGFIPTTTTISELIVILMHYDRDHVTQNRDRAQRSH